MANDTMVETVEFDLMQLKILLRDYKNLENQFMLSNFMRTEIKTAIIDTENGIAKGKSLLKSCKVTQRNIAEKLAEIEND